VECGNRGCEQVGVLSSAPRGACAACALGAGELAVFLPRYFTSKRAMCSGMSVAGSGVGTLVLSNVSSALIADVGWRRTLQILAYVTAVGNVAAAFTFKPVGDGTAPSDSRARPLSEMDACKVVGAQAGAQEGAHEDEQPSADEAQQEGEHVAADAREEARARGSACAADSAGAEGGRAGAEDRVVATSTRLHRGWRHPRSRPRRVSRRSGRRCKTYF